MAGWLRLGKSAAHYPSCRLDIWAENMMSWREWLGFWFMARRNATGWRLCLREKVEGGQSQCLERSSSDGILWLAVSSVVFVVVSYLDFGIGSRSALWERAASVDEQVYDTLTGLIYQSWARVS